MSLSNIASVFNEAKIGAATKAIIEATVTMPPIEVRKKNSIVNVPAMVINSQTR